MKKIEEITNLLLENDDVPDPEVATVVAQVRTGASFPPPAWFGLSKQRKDSEPSK